MFVYAESSPCGAVLQTCLGGLHYFCPRAYPASRTSIARRPFAHSGIHHAHTRKCAGRDAGMLEQEGRNGKTRMGRLEWGGRPAGIGIGFPPPAHGAPRAPDAAYPSFPMRQARPSSPSQHTPSSPARRLSSSPMRHVHRLPHSTLIVSRTVSRHLPHGAFIASSRRQIAPPIACDAE